MGSCADTWGIGDARFHWSRVLAIALSVWVWPHAANSQSIWFDGRTDPFDCSLDFRPTVPPFVGPQFKVYLNTGNLDGIQSVELLIEGLPSGVTWSVVPNPIAVVSGDVFSDGATLTFPECQTDYNVLLYTVAGLAGYPDPATGVLSVMGRPTSDPPFDCPFVTLCDGPAATRQCVPGVSSRYRANKPSMSLGSAISNPVPADGATNVPLNATLEWDWGGIPELFCTPTAIMHFVYLGAVRPPPLATISTCGPGPEHVAWDPGLLLPDTTYYWGVADGERPTVDPLWTFTTGRALAVTRSSWQHVKALYR